MSKVWLFGGSKKPFGEKLTADLNASLFGRHNTNYSKPEEFIQSIKEVPDVIVFNLGNHYHDFHDKDFFTSQEVWNNLREDTMATQYFGMRLTEWLLSNYSKKNIIWLTSMSPYDNMTENYNPIYRISRSIEHQIIIQFNMLSKMKDSGNVMTGLCVGNNTEGTPEFINWMIKNNKLEPGLFGLYKNPDNGSFLSTEIELKMKEKKWN